MSYVFVGGCQRSGTTLLQALMCRAHGANRMVREAKYFRYLVESYARARLRFKAETADYFTDVAQFNSFHADLLRRFLEHSAAHLGRTEHLVLKDPENSRVFVEILELIPQAKCLCIVRDPRDVIASLLAVGRRFARAGLQNTVLAPLLSSRNMVALSRHYLSYYRRSLALRGKVEPDRLVFVRYEDLVRTPAREIERIGEITGLRFDRDAGVDPDFGGVSRQTEDRYSRAWFSDLYGKAVTSERIGRYSEALSTAEVTVIVRLCGPFMRQFDYH
jgi:hypothetical protein